MDSNQCKKYITIPIISHESEKPNIIFEEIGSGKLYPTNYLFLNSKDNSSIIVHESEKPCLVFEEVNSIVIPKFEEETEKPCLVFEEVNSIVVPNFEE